MIRKCVVLCTALIFFIEIPSLALCSTGKSKTTLPSCLGSTSSVSSDSKDCFFHCSTQSVIAVKTEYQFKEDLKIKTASILGSKYYGNLKYFARSLIHAPSYYLSQVIIKPYIYQTCFAVLLNHAPPFSLISNLTV